mgnify:CR=1 FL=1
MWLVLTLSIRMVPVADPTDLLKLKNGVTTQIVDGKDYFVDGTVRDMRAFTFEQ